MLVIARALGDSRLQRGWEIIKDRMNVVGLELLFKNGNGKGESRCASPGRGQEVRGNLALLAFRVSSPPLPGPRVMASFQGWREELSVQLATTGIGVLKKHEELLGRRSPLVSSLKQRPCLSWGSLAEDQLLHPVRMDQTHYLLYPILS